MLVHYAVMLICAMILVETEQGRETIVAAAEFSGLSIFAFPTQGLVAKAIIVGCRCLLSARS
jgi:hypothetical protein